MTYKEIVELIKLVNKTDLTEVNIKDGEFKLRIRTKDYQSGKQQVFSNVTPALSYQPAGSNYSENPTVSAPKAVETSTPDLPKSTEPQVSSKLVEIKSPIVGTFYRSSTPEKPVYVKVGDEIQVGSVVCIVEAMKLFNEIESEVSGKIVKVMVEDASPVEYDQVLFLVDPS